MGVSVEHYKSGNKRFRASGFINGLKVHIGMFATRTEAQLAFDLWHQHNAKAITARYKFSLEIKPSWWQRLYNWFMNK